MVARVAAASIAVITALTASSAQAPRPVVEITVAVVDHSGRPMPGLSAADFSVSAGGLNAPVLSVSTEERPLAIALVIDQSASLQFRDVRSGFRSAYVNTSLPLLDYARQTIEGVLDAGRPGDELHAVRLAGPTVAAAGPLRATIGPVMEVFRRDARCTGQGSPLWDAIAIGANRLQKSTLRRLVLVLTDGQVTGSWLSREATTEYAARLGVAVSIIDEGRAERVAQDDGAVLAIEAHKLLRALADHTGGEYLPDGPARGLRTTDAPFDLARRAVRGRRHSYGLRVEMPEGVRRAATHVSVRHPGLVVRAPGVIDLDAASSDQNLTREVQSRQPGDCPRR